MLDNEEKAIFDYQNLMSKFPQSPYVAKAQERLEELKKEQNIAYSVQRRADNVYDKSIN